MHTLHLSAAEPADVQLAARLLRAGETVAFPTETVYGLGANALSAEAVGKIFQAKQRPAWDPLIVHVPSFRAAAPLLALEPEGGNELARRVRVLAETFWPGPLTLLLPRSPLVPDAVTAGRPLVGIRVPAHPAAQALLAAAALPLAAPSANTFSYTSPTNAEHVLHDLDGRIAAVLDGGPTSVGVESTVLDPALTPMILYRPGAVTAAQIGAATGVAVEEFRPPQVPQAAPRQGLPAPGVGLRHYAPRARLVLVEGEEAALREAITEALHGIPEELLRGIPVEALRGRALRGSVAALVPAGWDLPGSTEVWADWNDPGALAATLFASLRALDARGVAVIFCPLPAPGGLNDAIRDRLRKAALRPDAE